MNFDHNSMQCRIIDGAEKIITLMQTRSKFKKLEMKINSHVIFLILYLIILLATFILSY